MIGRGRLAQVFGHAWRVRSIRPAAFALLDTVAVWPLRAFWTTQAPWYAGKYVEWRGHIVKLDDCRLDVSADVFSTFHRGCLWLHRHEEPERLAIVRFLDPDLPVVELGASTGALSCLINRRLRVPEAHVAVEANPTMIPVLERNRGLNACRFTILHAAVAGDSQSVVHFSEGADHLAGQAGLGHFPDSSLDVVTLDSLLARFTGKRVTLVCDIEGMEVDIWRHHHREIAQHVACFIVELHESISGRATVERLLREIPEQGFAHVWARNSTHVFQNTR